MKKEPLAVSAPISVMDRLKQATHSQHTQTEQIRAMQRLFAPDYALVEYQQHLEKMYGYLSGLEPLIFQALNDEALRDFFQARRKQPWLASDLRQFGLSDAQISALPVYAASLEITEVAQALGAWYVIEGSTLGGQVIVKQLSRHFGEAAANKLQYYQGYSEQTRLQWQAFCAMLTARFPDAHSAEVEQLLSAATATFASLASWLESV